MESQFKIILEQIGIYGVPGPVKRRERFDAVDALRKMEKCVQQIIFSLVVVNNFANY